MVRPISNDLRKRVITAVSKGESCRSAAVRFGVAVSSVVKWSQRYRSTGSVAPGKMGGHRKPVLDPHRPFIVKRLSQTPHLTLHALKDELVARGVKVSHNTVWLFLRHGRLQCCPNLSEGHGLAQPVPKLAMGQPSKPQCRMLEAVRLPIAVPNTSRPGSVGQTRCHWRECDRPAVSWRVRFGSQSPVEAAAASLLSPLW
jgi:transposase